MAATTAFRRLFLRGLYAEATRLGLGFEAALTAAVGVNYAATKTGKVIIATGAAGRTVQFNLPSSGGLTPVEIGELVSDLFDLFDTCQSALISAGITSPTDAQIFAEMKSRLQPVTESRTDFIGLRLGHGKPVTITEP